MWRFEPRPSCSICGPRPSDASADGLDWPPVAPVYHPAVSKPPGPSSSGSLRERWAVVAILGLVVLTRLPTLSQPLVEKHDWRQTQTAYTALIYSQSGIDLLHPQVPVLGPPFDLPFEFPLYQAIASIPMTAGVDPDLALRVVCLITFLATAVLLWGLIRHVAGSTVAMATLVFFAFSPLAIVWSRTSMIEYTATAGALAMVWAGIVWRERRGALLYWAAFAAAMVAMLVKPTTGAFYLLPLFLFRVAAERDGIAAFIRARLDPRLIGLAVLPLVAAIVWTRYADGIKAANVLTAAYTTEGLYLWNFGTLAQRLQPANWLTIGRRLGGAILGIAFAPLVLIAVVPMLQSRQRLFWLGIVGVAVLPIVVLFNLYLVHDYYLTAISPAWAAILGLGGGWLWDRLVDHRRVLVGLFSAAVVVAAVAMADYVTPIYRSDSDPMAVLPMAQELASLSHPNDQVLVLGREWSPSVHYYARRTGFAVPWELMPPGIGPAGESGAAPDWWTPTWVDRLAAQAKAARDYPIMIATDPTIDPIWLVARWPWMGVLGPRTYVVGDRADQLRGAGLVATDTLPGTGTGPGAGEGSQLLGGPVVLRCDPDVALDVPPGVQGTWITLEGGAPREARIRVSPTLAPILARRTVVASVAVAPPGEHLKLSCTGADSLVIERVDDRAPPPTR